MRGGAACPVRLRFSKRGKVRWISHRDLARAFERALRVERLPLAFSEGFSPHPKVSFGLALPVGAESEAEYLDMELLREVDLATLPGRLTPALPDGVDVVAAVPLAERAPALQEAVTAVVWRVEVLGSDAGPPLSPEAFAALAGEALVSPTLETARRRKGREVVDDVRPVIRRIDVVGPSARGVRCEMEMSTQPRGAKPGEVLAAIAAATGSSGGPDGRCVLAEGDVLRTHQWIEREGARCEPLDADPRVRVPEARAS
ncbi:MAG: TIGR03936 family radical SAM-associated protein [Acidimicrobiia bacterium]|nr:TIGR03936 family radical SAM-associated protein [Acidimicrobiia bacterium]